MKRSLLRPAATATPEVNGSSLTAKLEAYWRMEEADSQSRLDSAASHDLTQVGGVTQDAVNGKINNCAKFSGVNQYLKSAALLDFTDFTAAGWARVTTGTPSFPDIIARWNDFGDQKAWTVEYGTSDNKFKLFHSENGLSANSLATVVTTALDTWAFFGIRISRTNRTVDFRVNASDGVQVTSRDVKNDSLAALTIGASLSNLDVVRDLKGLVDEIGIWSRILTNAELTALYNAGDGLAYPFTA